MIFAALTLLLATMAGDADEAPAARARLNAIVTGLEAIERDMPRITAAAEQAAEAYVAGADLALRGGALHLALAQQPGGFNDEYGLPGDDDSILLIASDDPAAHRTPHRGAVVIAIGSRPLENAIWLDNHAQNETSAALTAGAAGALRCEMFAACVRRGHVPVIQQSTLLDTRRRRYVRYGNQRFHHDARLDPIPVGTLGTAYLRELRRVLRDVGTTSWPAITVAVDDIRLARDSGGRAFARFGPAYPAQHLSTAGSLLPFNDTPSSHDVVIAFHDDTPRWLDWHELQQIRASSHVTWIIPTHDVRPGDIFYRDLMIDLQCPLGDALIAVPGYDTRLGPASPVITAAILCILQASP